jgi:hypothetical protein
MFLILVLLSYVYTFSRHIGSSDEVCHSNAVVPFDASRQSWECPQVQIYRCRLDTPSAEVRCYGWAKITIGDVSLTATYQRIDKHHVLSTTMTMECSQAWRAHTHIIVQDLSAIAIILCLSVAILVQPPCSFLQSVSCKMAS